MILKTLETFDGRKMKGHPRFSEKERNKDASIRLYISSINTLDIPLVIRANNYLSKTIPLIMQRIFPYFPIS